MKFGNLVIMACLLLGPAQAAQNLPESRVVEILGYCHICEDGGTAYESNGKLSRAERDAFREWFKTTEDPVAVISRLVPDDSKRATAVVIAAEEFDDNQFYRVSLNALHRFADGEAGQKELQKVLMPGEQKNGLLAAHYRDPVLQSTLKRCLDRGISNPNYVSYANAILSGQAAKDVIEWGGAGFQERYVRLAEKALKNEDGFKRDPKPRPWLQQVATTTREVGTQWIWIVVILALMFTAWGVRKLRS
jgi:hypothetical protein